MPLILHIDTATPHASVGLSKDGEWLGLESSGVQKDHAAFVQPAIQQLVARAGLSLSHVDAIAVSNGPGSYTGLRVGLSTAKGIAYALDKPLILLNTLEVIASAAWAAGYHTQPGERPVVFCPMIDARRMEVFTAVYDDSLTILQAPAALVLDEQSFQPYLEKYTVIFCGNGAGKFKNLVHQTHAVFPDIQHDARHMQPLAEKLFLLKSFADKAYSEPFYLKEFFTPPSKLKSD